MIRLIHVKNETIGKDHRYIKGWGGNLRGVEGR
jgi:hypothetical protein